MKLEKEVIDFDFSKKTDNHHTIENNPNKSKFILSLLKKVTFFSSSVVLIGSFLKLNNIDFQQQITFIQNKNFNLSVLTFFSILMILKCLNALIDSTKNNERLNKQFSSIWTPFEYAFIVSLVLPYTNNNSLFSDSLVFIIEKLQHFF